MKKKKAAPHSRFNTERKISIFWTLFIGIGAVGGAVTMLVDPSGGLMGMDAMLPYFKKLPFADVLFTDSRNCRLRMCFSPILYSRK